MTTVVYRDGVFAADSRLSAGKMTYSNDTHKLVRFKNGAIFGWAGDWNVCLRVTDVLRDFFKSGGTSLPQVKAKQAEGLLWTPDDQLWYFCSDWIKLRKGTYHSIGSGCPYALAAMDAGADAVKAVRVAIKRDPSSGGPIKTIKVK